MWWTHWRRPEAIQDFLLIGSTVMVETPIGVIDVAVETPSARQSRDGAFTVRRRLLRTTETAGGAQKRRGVETALDDQGMLRGRIFVLPRQRNKARRRTQNAWLAALRQRLRSDAELTDADLEAFLPEISAGVSANSHLSVSLEVALFRTGEVRIWFEDEVAEALTEKKRKDISRQAYFFVKDMVHHHIHHDPKSDQITPLTEIGDAAPGAAEELWRRETVWSLSRAVDALARRGKLQDLREATGILAYADAFQKTLLLYRRKTGEPAAFEPNAVTYRYDFAHIRESLKVQIEQVTSRRTSLSQMLVAGLAGCLAATSLLASTISAFNGSANTKLALKAVGLPFDRPVLQAAADYAIVPAIFVGAFLWFVSSLILSEDRIGAKPAARRKLAQAVRGIANSIAKRRGWTGRHVQRWLERFYIFLFALLLGITVAGVPYVIGFARALGRLNITFIADATPANATALPKKTHRLATTPKPAPTPTPVPTASAKSPQARRGGTH
jgi:hypothetical protein